MAVAHQFGEKSRTSDVLITESVDFTGLLLSQPVLKGLQNAGFERPSPIQLKAIPLGRCGLDLIVQAKSGTGKTCVFSVIMLENIEKSAPSTQALVLAPTREIAIQIWEVIQSIGSAIPGLHCHTFIGGLPLHEDKRKLQRCHIAVGTPGRIQNLIEHGVLKTDSIRLFVLDEADKLLEESFQSQINWIYSALPDNKQMLALSATYPEYLAQHLTKYMRNPTFIRLNITDPTLLGIKQYYITVPSHPLLLRMFEAKTAAVVKILSNVSFHQCLIFSNMQTRAQNLESELTSRGWPAACIAGSLDQKERISAMSKLKTYQCRVLISTDLTSRGIDADRVNLVINLDVPRDHETYLHRIGRAGRFGSYGAGVTIVSEGEELLQLHAMERQIGTNILPLPDPIPSDLVQQQLKVSLDDVVSTEQLVSHGRTREFIANGADRSSMSDKKDVDSRAIVEAELPSELSKPEEQIQQGLESNEHKEVMSVVTATTPEDAVPECFKQVSVDEEHKWAAALAKTMEPLCDGETIQTPDQVSIGPAADPSLVQARLHAPDTADGDEKAGKEAGLAAVKKDGSFGGCGSGCSREAGDGGGGLAPDAKPFCLAAPDSGQETVCDEMVTDGAVSATLNVDATNASVLLVSEVESPSASVAVLNSVSGDTYQCKEDAGSKVGTIVQKLENSSCGTLSSSKNLHYPNSDDETYSSPEISESSGGIIENKPSPQRYKKAHSAANTWSAILSERSEEQRSSTPQSQNKSNSAASVWTCMLNSDLVKDRSGSSSPSDSFSSSSSDVKSSNHKCFKGAKKERGKKQADLSFESELQDYIRARAKMEEKKDKEGDAVPSHTKDFTKRPQTKAKRKFAADGATSHRTSEHILSSSTAKSSTVLLSSPSNADQIGFTKINFSSVSQSPEKTRVTVVISGDKTMDGLKYASANEQQKPIVHLQTTNPLSSASSTVPADKMGGTSTGEQRVLNISLPPAPKLALSSRSSTKINAAFHNYSSALHDYRNFLETASRTPTLLSARQLVQKTSTMIPAIRTEQERQDFVCFLQQFQRSLAETEITGLSLRDTTDSFVAEKQAGEIPDIACSEKQAGEIPEIACSEKQAGEIPEIACSEKQAGEIHEIACSEKILTRGGVATASIVMDTEKHETNRSDVQNGNSSDRSEEHAGEICLKGNQGKTCLEIDTCEKDDDRSVKRDKVADGKSDKQLPRSGTVQKPQRRLRLQGYMTVCGPATEHLFGFMKNSGTVSTIAESKDKETEEQERQLDGQLPSSQVGPVLEGCHSDVPISALKEIQNHNTASVKEKSLEVFQNKEFASGQQKFLTPTVALRSQSEGSEIMGKGAIPKQIKMPTEKPLLRRKPATRNQVSEQEKQEQKETCSDDDMPFMSSSSSSSSSTEAERIVKKGEDSSICFQNLYTSDSAHHPHTKKLSSKALGVSKEREEKAKGVSRIGLPVKDSENILLSQNEKSAKRQTKSKKMAKRSERKMERFSETLSEPLTDYKSWLRNYYNSYGMNPDAEILSYPWAYAWSQMGFSQPYQMALPPSYSMHYTKPEASIKISAPLPEQSQPPHFSHQPEYYHQPQYPPPNYISQQPEYYPKAQHAHQNYISQQPDYHQLRYAPLNYVDKQLYSSTYLQYISQQRDPSTYPLGVGYSQHPDSFCPQPRSNCFDPNSQSHMPSYPGMETPLYYPGSAAVPTQSTKNGFRSRSFHADHPAPINSRGMRSHIRAQSAMSIESAWSVAEQMQKYIRRMAKFYARLVDHES